MWIFGRHKHLAEDALSDYVSGRLSPHQNERVQRSLDECVTCRQELESLQLTSSLLRELPAHELPRSFVFATAPGGASPVPSIGVNATRSWTFRPPGWAYAGAASVVGLAVAVFVISSEASLWLPGAERGSPQAQAIAAVSALPESQPAPMALAEESRAPVPELPETGAEVAVMAESEFASDVPPLAAPAAPASFPEAPSVVMEPASSPAPEGDFLAPESYEAPIGDAAPAAASSEATMEEAPPLVPAAESMAKEQMAGAVDAPNDTYDDGGEAATQTPPTAPPVMAMAESPPGEEAAALAPPPISDRPDVAAMEGEPAAMSPEAEQGVGRQESPEPDMNAGAIASSEPGVMAGVGKGMPDPQPTAGPPKAESNEATAGEAATAEGKSMEEPGFSATLPPKPVTLASASNEISAGEPEPVSAETPDSPVSAPDQGNLQPASAELSPSEPVAISGSRQDPGPAGPAGVAGNQGLVGPAGPDARGPVGPQGSPGVGAMEDSAAEATETGNRGAVDGGQSPQPSPGNGDAAIPGFGIRYEILLAVAATAAALILFLALFGLYRFWAGRHPGGKSGTNGAADPSLLVNRPKLVNGGG